MSVRVVAEELGVARNTALRALKLLRSVGLVEQHQDRGEAGRFDAASYRLHLPTDVIGCAQRPYTRRSRRNVRVAQSAPNPLIARSATDFQQLVLLPPD